MLEPPEPLLECAVDPDPLVQFGRWFDDAATVIESPEAMALASVGTDARPSVRMVLLKEWGADGFVFFTNYDSRKGRELAIHPGAALLFYWEPCGRQVRIEGEVVRLDQLRSDSYFAARARGSQIGAHASRQSRVIADRPTLEANVKRVDEEFAGRPVPRPDAWGGLQVIPTSFEFWQHRNDRLHDRLKYTPGHTGWQLCRLQP